MYGHYNNFMFSVEDTLEDCKNTLSDTLDISFVKLDKIPEEVKEYFWVEKLELGKLDIEELENLPPLLKSLKVIGCKLKKVDGTKLPSTLEFLEVSSNMEIIEEMSNLPEGLKQIEITDNKERLSLDLNFSNLINLKEIKLGGNNLKNFPKISNSVEYIDISNNNLTDLPILNDNLEELDISNNNIKEILKLPKNLKKICAYKNNISVLCQLPENMEEIDVDDNQIMYFPHLPKNIIKIHARNNRINAIMYKEPSDNYELPNNLELIDLRSNPLTQLLDKIKNDERVRLDKEMKVRFINNCNTNRYTSINFQKEIVV